MSTQPNPEHQEENKPLEPQILQQLNRKSVMHYLVILFAAAFCLMLLTYLMERRTNETELTIMSGYMDIIIDDKGTVEEQRNTLLAALATAEADISHQAQEYEEMETHYQEQIEDLIEELTDAEATIAQLEDMLADEGLTDKG